MEVFTRKKPTDEMFNGNFKLRDWVNDSVSNALFDQIVDASLINLESNKSNPEILKCSSQIFQVGLNCSEESPKNRINMEEVLAALNKIKLQTATLC